MPYIGKFKSSMNVVYRRWGECKWDSNRIIQNFVSVIPHLLQHSKALVAQRNLGFYLPKEKHYHNLQCFPEVYCEGKIVFTPLIYFICGFVNSHFVIKVNMLLFLSYNHT